MLTSRQKMDLRDDPKEAAFRLEARSWLEENLTGRFAEAAGAGGPGREHEDIEVRREWEMHLGRAGWTCVGWPQEWGGRGASLSEQVIWNEEYVRANAPARIGVLGEGLLGPALIAYGTEQQKRRFLPRIRLGEELWCQGFSEPSAGSDLASVQTRAELRGGEWVVTGQKVWTSLAHIADWCFVLCRTDPAAPKHEGLSYILVPMDQPGVEVRPIRQMTGTSEFNEVFFDGARSSADMVVGEVNGGWKVALATLSFERGAAMLGHLLSFERELEEVIEIATKRGLTKDAVTRERIVRAWTGLKLMRWNALRSMPGLAEGGDSGIVTPQASISKLFWGGWHRSLGELATDVLGMDATVATAYPYELSALQRAFLFGRAETIYGGSDEIQRNVIGERVLGLPKEPGRGGAQAGSGSAR